MSDNHELFGVTKDGMPVWKCNNKGMIYKTIEKESCPHCKEFNQPKRRKRRTRKTETQDE